MQYAVVGILAKYGNAEAAMLDLESAGIVGGQVEVITNIDEDARTANTPGEPSTKTQEPPHNWITRLFGAGGSLEKAEVRDASGEQPNYIGDQEFYATHVKQGGAVMIVRTSTELLANRAAAILRDHGARTPGSKKGPAVSRTD